MNRFIVTIRLPKNPDHNPHSKKTGICPASGAICTDVTGEHHSYLLFADDIDAAREGAINHLKPGARITRIEAV